MTTITLIPDGSITITQEHQLVRLGTGALIGGATASLFTSIPFFGGVFFGATFYVVQILTEMAVNELFNDGPTLRIIKFAIPIILGIALAALAATAIGVVITFQTGVVLTLAMLITHVVLNLLATQISSCLDRLHS